MECKILPSFSSVLTLQNEKEVKIIFKISVMSANEGRKIDNSQINSNVPCNICSREFITNRGLLFRVNACRRKQQEQQNQQWETNDDQGNTHRLQDLSREPINKSFLLEQQTRYNLCQWIKQRVWQDCLLEKKLVSSPSKSWREMFYPDNDVHD